ncbi:hypothetical protein SAMN03080617_03684 [Algoriphagus alkaliphilus]|uniref:Uncharacterized protein n=1 Tax=Algoriphagus alkaliphilus TaxID=279824 RepID=A0A1G5ZF55_9BACT|nr:hypothetical protein [Algoriphagus alkaliphilus]SDA93100.1 hypothetical protein SAMN03080617_03684 [Algoriphagus alkaliphilus]
MMPTNLLKNYPDLLEIMHLSERERTISLRSIFRRDVEENPGLNFRTKIIRPIKGEEPAMDLLFKHLTTEEIQEMDENGKEYPKRIFEKDRSQRLHWVRFHLEESKKEGVEIFSVEERDQKKRVDIIRTYIFDVDQNYVIVLDPQRSLRDYYLVTAYYLNKDYGAKKIKKLLKKKLPILH